MPELPDVEGFKAVLDTHCLNGTIRRATILDDRIVAGISPARLARRLRGQRSLESARHGKILFARMAEDQRGASPGWLVLRFGMTGALIFQASQEAALPKYARLTLDLEDSGRLAYLSRRMLGHVTFTDDRDGFLVQEGLGPDALNNEVNAGTVGAFLEGRRASVKSLLMDQSLIAGIGNIYADEILFQARLHPARRGAELGRREVERLVRTLERVLRTAAARGGDVNRLPKGYLLPHRAPGASCPKCDATVATIKISGRTSFFCPVCQPEASRA